MRTFVLFSITVLALAATADARPRLLHRVFHKAASVIAPHCASCGATSAVVVEPKSDGKPAAKVAQPAPPPLTAP